MAYGLDEATFEDLPGDGDGQPGGPAGGRRDLDQHPPARPGVVSPDVPSAAADPRLLLLPRHPRRRPLPDRRTGRRGRRHRGPRGQPGRASGERNWANDHAVYTHGYGVVAALRQRLPAPTGGRRFFASDIPHRSGELGHHAAADLLRRGLAAVLDRRGAGGHRAARAGLPGRHVGAAARRTTPTRARAASRSARLFNKLLFAPEFQDPNILLSEPGERRVEDPLRPRPARRGSRRSRRG